MCLVRYILVVMMVGSFAHAARSESAPSTFYSVDQKDPYAPVEKKVSDKPLPGYLRDPNAGGRQKIVQTAPVRSRKSQLSYTKKQHGFAPAKIKGSLRVPRVAFAQETLELTKLPDELPKVFLDKPFTPDGTNY